MTHEEILAKHSEKYAGFLKMYRDFSTRAKAQLNHEEALAAMAEAVAEASHKWMKDDIFQVNKFIHLEEQLAKKDKEIAELKETINQFIERNNHN